MAISKLGMGNVRILHNRKNSNINFPDINEEEFKVLIDYDGDSATVGKPTRNDKKKENQQKQTHLK